VRLDVNCTISGIEQVLNYIYLKAILFSSKFTLMAFKFIDLFAGAGGLTEGFQRVGFEPIAHVEVDKWACRTLETRAGYYYLEAKGKITNYLDYISGKIYRADFLADVPDEILNSVINVDISESSLDSIFDRIDSRMDSSKVDVIIGGPPCQAYSLVGRSRDPRRMKGDKRNFLYKFYAEFLKKYRPKFFIFENVTGLLSAGDYFMQMVKLFESSSLGYKVDWEILNASDYGVLQNRKRVILIGKHKDPTFSFPHIDRIKNEWTVKLDLFADLPVIAPGEEMLVASYTKKATNYLDRYRIRNGLPFTTQHLARPHNKRDLEIYKIAIDNWLTQGKRMKYNELPERLKTHKNQKVFLDRYKVVDPYGSSHTIVAHIAKDGHYYIYPDLAQVRSLSVREAARIQSFPDDFYFEGGRSAAFKQIGNAVPPLLAESIALKINELMLNS
jgi:DNA (cytosine-5)-methyltransferase 1